MSFEDYKANELIHENTVIDNKKRQETLSVKLAFFCEDK